MDNINVLVFPCGSEIALEVYESLNDVKNITLFGGSSVEDHGKFVFENYIDNIPFVNDDNFIPYIKDIVSKYNIDVLYPCMDIVITKLKENEAQLNCKVIASSIETTQICLSKAKTYEKFKNLILVPKIYSKTDKFKYPIFSKPEVGASSRFTFKINDSIDLEYYTQKYPNNLLMEYLPGSEYTIDCFTNFKGELLFTQARKRNRISNGISVNMQLVNDSGFKMLANTINDNLKLNGAWFFQVKENTDGELTLMEIASRFGGSSSINRFLGVNFAHLSILNMFDTHTEIITNNYNIECDRALNVKSKIDLDFSKVYVDLDDTLIIKNKINTELIKLIYQFINEDKSIILITKHKGNLTETLSKHKLTLLFNKIIHLSIFEEKSEYMHHDSIFIDDSFLERKKVKNNLNIPVFSVDSIKTLLK
jgi:hypothetical protein